MEMTNSVWGKGQLMAMSGLEGRTDYAEGLVLRTRENGVIDLKFPSAGGRIVLSEDKPQKCLLLSDAFETEHAKGVVVDAYHILIESHRRKSGRRESSGRVCVVDGRKSPAGRSPQIFQYRVDPCGYK